MARPLRIEFDGAWYHVMNRGAGKQAVFLTDKHRRYFLSLLEKTAERFNAEWHAYCLMDNHYHLMLRTPNGNLQRIMRHVNGVYTQYFNRTTQRDGALFRGRYKAVLIDADAHWLNLSGYIHRNPVEAGLVDNLANYRWSSYLAYLDPATAPNWLHTKYILQAISAKQNVASYQAFVEAGVNAKIKAFYSRKKLAAILGDKEFTKQILKGAAQHIDTPALQHKRTVPTVEQIVAAVSQAFQTEPEQIWHSQRGKKGAPPIRGAAMYLCQNVGMMTLTDIAQTFGLAHYASASSSISYFRRRCQQDAELQQKLNLLVIDLTPL